MRSPLELNRITYLGLQILKRTDFDLPKYAEIKSFAWKDQKYIQALPNCIRIQKSSTQKHLVK